MISAKIILDSISKHGDRLITIEATYPRIILPEVLTHREKSRNTASSRAIPSKKMISDVVSKPFIPVEWGKNKPGMFWNESLNQIGVDELVLVLLAPGRVIDVKRVI